MSTSSETAKRSETAQGGGCSDEHTPGPWAWSTSNSWRRLSSAARDGNVLCPTVQRSDGHPDVVVSEADMALMAAAPDLLAASEAALAYFDKYGALRQEATLLMAAIAKARGNRGAQ